MPSRRRADFGILQVPDRSPVPGLIRRIALAVGLILIVTVFLWAARAGLRDNTHPDRPMDFVGVLYFTVVTLTTVGYGDIIPVTPEARLINAILLTPIRIFLWALFLGTAYDLFLERHRERVQLQKLKDRLKGHSIVCGYGVKGRAIIGELMAHGHQPADIVVIEPGEEAAREAAATDIATLRGDASAEAILQLASVETAEHVLVATDRDDAAVLICLTVRSLAPNVRLIAAAREEENVKLLYRAGADVVISPSVSGGRLMATAVKQQAVTTFLEDLLSFGKGVDASERLVRQDEEGKLVADLQDLSGRLVLGVARGGERCPFFQLKDFPLKAGDRIVYLVSAGGCEPEERA
jgi:voltage-gated potassium channel